jgi:hypothetical protein
MESGATPAVSRAMADADPDLAKFDPPLTSTALRVPNFDSDATPTASSSMSGNFSTR